MEQPSWLLNDKIVKVLDAKPLLMQGIHPLEQVIADTAGFAAGDIFELNTPFIPHPMIEKMKAKGFATYSIQDSEVGFRTFFCKI